MKSESKQKTQTKNEPALDDTSSTGTDLEVGKREATQAELAVINAVRADKRAQVRAPNLNLDFDEETREVFVEHEGLDGMSGAALTMHELGTSDLRFYEGIMKHIIPLGDGDKTVSAPASNFVLSVVAGVQPKDHIEAMLAVQMGTVHQATMVMARRLNHSKHIAQQDAAERALNKLARTFTSQVETLKRYRSKADQTVRVERVEVNEGGQAIVGDVHHGGGADEKK